jgi:hypothetical protein
MVFENTEVFGSSSQNVNMGEKWDIMDILISTLLSAFDIEQKN